MYVCEIVCVCGWVKAILYDNSMQRGMCMCESGKKIVQDQLAGVCVKKCKFNNRLTPLQNKNWFNPNIEIVCLGLQ